MQVIGIGVLSQSLLFAIVEVDDKVDASACNGYETSERNRVIALYFEGLKSVCEENGSLSHYKSNPESLYTPPEGPNSYYLVIKDKESETYCGRFPTFDD
ncbi:hypothetical protein CTI12_AA546660 [Artemisia annua]|uniref:Uncharacterized protein n=1 Tax=Artemisia annua TaxID=35608 RepID=A0A2U1KYT4_ARTAN|nr:hypothetical protein CTI12_AA546660 [Artemisia annua]